MADTPINLTTEGTPTVGISTEVGSPRSFDLSDKLKIVNEALLNTGNNPVATADDGSAEWQVASSAFDQWAPILLHRRNWNFASRIQQLARIGDSVHPGYSDVFAKPADTLFLIDVYRVDVAETMRNSGAYLPSYNDVSTRDNVRLPQLDYQIIGDRIYANAPDGAAALYTPFPVGSQPWSPGFVAALRLKIEAAIYRGLNEDMQSAMQFEKLSEAALNEASARCAQEEPRKVAFRNRLGEARWRRRDGGRL